MPILVKTILTHLPMKYKAIKTTTDAYNGLTPSQRMELFKKQLLIDKAKKYGKIYWKIKYN